MKILSEKKEILDNRPMAFLSHLSYTDTVTKHNTTNDQKGKKL